MSSWVKKNCKFAQIIEKRASDEKDDKPIYVQWMTSNGKHFFPAAEVQNKLKPGLYTLASTPNGFMFIRSPIDTKNLIKFPDSESDKVIDEISKFWDREAKFREKGLPFKRGLLLYGPPGSGKTSTLKIAMSDVINRGGLVVKMDSPHDFEEGIQILRGIEPETPVITLMEDIDQTINSYGSRRLLDILDGVVPVDRCVFIATTNFPERLDSRIMNRPSRFDKRFLIGLPNKEARKMYLEYLLGKDNSDIETWSKDTEGMSLSHLKELVVDVTILGNKYTEAISNLKAMKKGVSSSQFDPFEQYAEKIG